MENLPHTELGGVDAETQALARRTPDIVSIAHAFNVTSREEFLEGAKRLRNVKDLWDRLEEKRTSVTAPLNNAMRIFNGWFRTPLDQLKYAENVYKTKMGEFERAEQERERKARAEAERKVREEREELERRAEAARAKGNEEKAAALEHRATSVVAEVPDIIAPKAKGMGFGSDWTFEVTDASKLPREYLAPDLPKIRLMVKALKNKEHAERQIPGITVTEVPRVSVRR
jgi:hypothetical protein